MEASFKVVEPYYRQEHFDFFRRYRSPFYAATFELDATRLKARTAARGGSTYASLCYCFTRAMRGIEDFRYRFRDGRLVLYAELHMGLTVPAPGGRFGFAYLAWDPDPERFATHARRVLAEAEGRLSLVEQPHSNFIFYTALPRLPVTGLTHAEIGDPTEGEPRVACGKLVERGGRRMVPVGIQVNHAFIDGAALGELAERAQAEFDGVGEGG